MKVIKDVFSARPPFADRMPAFDLEGRSPENALSSALFELVTTRGFARPADFTPRDYQTSLRLIECAGQAMEILYDRRDALETSLKALSSQSADVVASAEAKVLGWQRHAATARSETQELERQLAAIRQRVEAAETQLEAQRSRADVAERQAGEAVAILEEFQSKVLATFGPETKAHRALMVTAEEPERSL